MGDCIERREFDEFKERLADQKSRWDKRLDILEQNMEQFHTLSVSIEKLATSVQQMAKELEEQGKRLKSMEDRDGEMWRKVISHIATAIAGAIIAFAFAKIGVIG